MLKQSTPSFPSVIHARRNVRATPVDHQVAVDFLGRKLGRSNVLRFEALTHHLFAVFTGSDRGYVWDACELTNAGFYVMPRSAVTAHRVCIDALKFDEVLSSAEVGLVATHHALDAMVELARDPEIAFLAEALHDYATLAHERGAVLARALMSRESF